MGCLGGSSRFLRASLSSDRVFLQGTSGDGGRACTAAARHERDLDGIACDEWAWAGSSASRDEWERTLSFFFCISLLWLFAVSSFYLLVFAYLSIILWREAIRDPRCSKFLLV